MTTIVPCSGEATVTVSVMWATVASGLRSVGSVAKASEADTVDLDIDGHTVSITHPDKVFFSTRGDTKLDLVMYYLRIGEALMRQMDDRPGAAAALPQRSVRLVVLPEADPRVGAGVAGDDDRVDAERDDVAGAW